MPESHNLTLVFMGINICTVSIILTCTNFDLVLVFFPPYHMFIHDDEDAVISILLVIMDIYMYIFIYFGIWFGPGLFPTLPHV